jgi:hypothetical protein
MTLAQVAMFPLIPIWALAAALAVRIGTCGRWVRERDTSTWPDIRDTARLAIRGSAAGLVLAGVVVAAIGPELGWSVLAATAWFALPAIVEGVLLLRCASLMERRARS